MGWQSQKFTDLRIGSVDHRGFNRHGEAFDRGETFSGVDYQTGLKAVEDLRALVPTGMSMTQLALRWILMFEAVTCAIPGARKVTQAEENIKAADFPAISADNLAKIKELYESQIRASVHPYW